MLPLTRDIPGAVNPFRCKSQTSQPSRLLFHAILALCCQHLERLEGNRSSEAAEHRRKAVQLLECALKSSPVLSLLDPILILFTLDASSSLPKPHEQMLIYCLVYPLRYGNLVDSPNAGIFHAPGPWRAKRIDNTSHAVTSWNANMVIV